MQTVLGRPKDLQKRERILQAAKELFLELGYDGCSMNKVAEKAGVTKLTVYNHFQDKSGLFVNAIEHACNQHIMPERLALDQNSNFIKNLAYICEQCLHICYLPEALKLEYLMLHLSANQNPMVEKFFNASHAKLNQVMADFLNRAAILGFIQQDDPQQQTELIMSLLCGQHFHQVLLGMRAIPDAPTRQHIVSNAIDVFMRKYAVAASCAQSLTTA